MHRFYFFLFFLGIPSSQAIAAVGGGYTACGLKGEYFPNPNLAAPAAFVRQDNRLRFDWQTNAPVGGSNTPIFRNFPRNNFSVRWTGKVMPRFSEKYIFTVDTGQFIRVWLNKDLIIDRWSKGVALKSKPVSLQAGVSYDLKVEFRQETGAAKLFVSWSSPSTPEEVIDPLSVNGFNLTGCGSVLYADEVKYGLVEETNGVPGFWYAPDDPRAGAALPLSDLDSSLWPKKDAQIRFNPYFLNATYKMQFTGKATVLCRERWFGGQGTFMVAGQTFQATLPTGTGYDPATNTTTALVTFSPVGGLTTQCLIFTHTQRTNNSPDGSGITNLHLMRPQSQSSGAAPCDVGTVVYPGAKGALQNYTVYRYFGNAFADGRIWSERTQPGMPNGFTSPPKREGYTNKPCWEDLIMLANEMGKDLYLSISSRADQDYYAKLANLVKYGSDGVNPYTSYDQWPASGPIYPPLNTNLRFYIEYSNEVWNFGFPQWGMINDDCKDAVDKNTDDGRIINYDGQGAGQWKRWQALQTVNISNAFRSVFGDAAMGDRIRILLFDQYGGYGNDLGQFIDDYFNKTDPKSTFTGTPHPVSYYIWGGGGAIYYGSNHPDGVDPAVQFANGSFETPALADGVFQASPTGSAWTFTDKAGICRNISRQQATTGTPTGTATNPKQRTWAGFKFTVGKTPIYVYDVGRVAAPGNSKMHQVQIFKADGTAILVNPIDTNGATPGQYQWTRVIEQGWTRNLQIPLLLEANTTYYAMSAEEGEDYLVPSTVQSSPGIIINGAATAVGDKLAFTDNATANTSASLVNFTYTDAPEGDLGFICDAPDGKQAAFIENGGTMSQSVNFSKLGTYAVSFHAAVKAASPNAVDIYVDGAKCTPLGGINPLWKVSESPWTPGGFERRGDDLAIMWGSATFPITQVGNHVIQFKGTGKGGQYIFFDDLKILNPDSIYGPNSSYFPSMGEANGQDPRGGLATFVDTLHNENAWASAWGLKTMAYEGGWSVGGDFDQKPIHSYCKFVDPLTIDADAKAINVYTSGGGALFCYYYSQWPDDDIDNATHSPLVQAVIKRNDLLPTEPDYGALVPGTLAPADSTLISSANADRNGVLSAQGAWMSWNVIAPATQVYHLVPALSGTASYVLLVDDTATVPAGSPESDATGIKLTKGQHTVKIRNTSSTAFTVQGISVTMKGAPAAPNLASANFGEGKCVLTWTAVPAAADYTVSYGTASGSYNSSVRAGNVTSFTIPNLDNSLVYYVAIQASNASGLLGLCSNELRVAHRSSNPRVLIDFEDQAVHTGPVDTTKPVTLTLQNYLFTAFGNSAILEVQGPESKWPSRVLSTCVWGNCHRIQRADFRPFDLYSLDLCSTHGSACAIIIGYDPSGATFKKIVNFNAPEGQIFVMPIILDWANVAKVEIRWGDKKDGGDTQGREGAIDNVLFNNQAPTTK